MESECCFRVTTCKEWQSAQKTLYTCFVASAEIKEPFAVIESFKGEHEGDKTDQDVEGISVLNTVVEYFPRRLHKTFPNLVMLQIINCGLKNISHKDLLGLENLNSITIVSNPLTTLPDDLFTDMVHLKKIQLSDNKIEFASSKLLALLDSDRLIMVDFRMNSCIDAFYSVNSDENCGSLNSLQDLMQVIDTKCKKPPIGEHQIESIGDYMSRMIELRNNDRLTDFTIEVRGAEFRVHKTLLIGQSPVFTAWFESNLDKDKYRMDALSYTAEAVEDFIEYIYAFSAPRSVNAIEVFKMAAFYDVSKLKSICENIILDNLDETNALEIFTLAYDHDCDKMECNAFLHIRDIFPDYILDESLMEKPKYLKELVDAKRHLDKLLGTLPKKN